MALIVAALVGWAALGPAGIIAGPALLILGGVAFGWLDSDGP